ncbi:MAG: tetratricopeptide repeat protein [Candidatus Omnitrophota bacterium]
MNKFKMMAICVGILVFVEGAGVLYFAHRAQALSEELENVAPGLKEELNILKKEKQKLEEERSSLADENERIKKDRENLLAQTKFLLNHKAKAEELDNAMKALEAKKQEIETGLTSRNKELEDTLRSEREKFGTEHSALKQQNSKLQGVVKQLMYIQKEVESERDYLQEAYDKLKDKSTITEFKKTISNITKDNKDLDNKFKLAERDTEKLKDLKNKADARIESLETSLDEYKKNYDDAKKKNNALEKEVKNMPKKFQELSRQNRTLIKETAKTHYNLGVFYTKEKEYDRGASEFAKAVEINPDDAYSHFNLGYLYAEHMVNRKKALEHFRHFLRLAKGNDKDIDWVRKYVLTWDTYEGHSAFK